MRFRRGNEQVLERELQGSRKRSERRLRDHHQADHRFGGECRAQRRALRRRYNPVIIVL